LGEELVAQKEYVLEWTFFLNLFMSGLLLGASIFVFIRMGASVVFWLDFSLFLLLFGVNLYRWILYRRSLMQRKIFVRL
jgi:hypothetical protein